LSWRSAFFAQAASDNAVRVQLNASSVAYSHRLHYLQMVTEKLSRGYAISPRASAPPARTHKAFVRFLQSLKSVEHVQRSLGFDDVARFRMYIDSLLDLADRIERLAPNFAGYVAPNPEYPWWNPSTGEVFAPCESPFELFDPTSPKMVKLERIIDALLREAA
jgi:hypothetical protein